MATGAIQCLDGAGFALTIDVKSFTKQIRDRQGMFRRTKDGTPRAPMKNRVYDDTLVLAGGASGPWTSHDLRRTGATMMQRLGVQIEVIDRCQNHVLGGSKVRRHYLHHDYADEKREAWRLSGEHLLMLLDSHAKESPVGLPIEL
ncbi:tyrosine-type recombinase/integrase [Pseudoduganella namucuonensis]|uniref:tyrosine-type recombinase/integrase n=1 Tax=Pseudoduganella namucuonensis TaxID=1035707 RepID=UPI000AA1C026|nr:tyrosine-type recombinase/integrase [Pseudoduganella namucuonensis]